MFNYGANFIYVKNNFMGEDDRSKVIKYFEPIPSTNRQRDVVFLEDIKDPEVAKIVKHYEKAVYTTVISEYAPNLDLRIERLSWMRRLEIVRWPNDSGLEPHRDGHKHYPDEPELSLSTLIYLNDDYEGGDVFFEEFNLNIKPKTGDLIIFPSYFLHEVRQVRQREGGMPRYTIPFFYTFEARRFGEYTHFSYLGQIEEHEQGKGEYFR
jgi:hypothetical protein